MDYNGNSIRENPFLKHDGAKRLIRRRPIIIRDNDSSKNDLEFKMLKTDDSSSNSSGSPTRDLEYGPGIVEKLRAKFARLSDASRNLEAKNPSPTVTKFNSCENLLEQQQNSLESESNYANLPAQNLESRRIASRSVSDMIGSPEVDFGEEQNAPKSIVELRQKFETNSEQIVQMRFARDPKKLIAKIHPEVADIPYRKPVESNTPFAQKKNAQEHSVSNVLKVLNDAPSEEPEFVQIARRLRRYQPDEIVTQIEDRSSISETPVRPAVNMKWVRRQPEMPNLSANAKIIRETCDITSILPTDPHSARTSKKPIPQISNETIRAPIESSPPPEEPKPTVMESFSILRKSTIDMPSERSALITNSVFKYENTPARPSTTMNSNIWRTSSLSASSKPEILSSTQSVLGKEDVESSSSTHQNVVSITVKGPTSNWIYSNYDKIESPSTEQNAPTTSPLKPPSIYSPSYTTNSKYSEEMKSSTIVNNSLNALLSPREKPYGDDVTILKSENTNVNPTNPPDDSAQTNIFREKDESEDGSTSDEDSRDGSYDVNPIRPTSLFTRLANEEEIGGDGNYISRSLLSLVADEDVADILVAMHEKPVNYIVIEESGKPSTSSILRVKDTKREEKSAKGSTRIRFCTESPMAYAYFDEATACRSLQWDDGTIVEYSYFKEAEEREMQNNDPTLSLIAQWEQQIANETIPTPLDSSFKDTFMESSLNPAY